MSRIFQPNNQLYGAGAQSHRPLEVLVFNCSHSDLLVRVEDIVDVSAGANPSAPYNDLAKPKFSCFHSTSERLKAAVLGSSAPHILTCPDDAGTGMFPVGFDLKSAAAAVSSPNFLQPAGASAAGGLSGGSGQGAGQDGSSSSSSNNDLIFPWRDFHTKDKDRPSSTGPSCTVSAVYLPLMAIVLPRWLQICEERRSGSRKVIYLISGSGTPRNDDVSLRDNSTETTAQLLRAFVQVLAPDVDCATVHSKFDILDFNANVDFVREELRPLLEEQRRKIAAAHASSWSDNFHVTVSMADGAAARVSAINMGTRDFAPDFLHVWQLKTFWHRQCLSKTDIKCHRFETLDMSPALPVDQVGDDLRALVAEVVRYKLDFERLRDGGKVPDVGDFWLRKTKKLVLSILVVQKPGQPPRYIRGQNIEVSLPTGSLCSERNAIGTAVSLDPTLQRKHFKMVAVLSLSLKPTPGAGGYNLGGGSRLPLPRRASGGGCSSGGAAVAAAAAAVASSAPAPTFEIALQAQQHGTGGSTGSKTGNAGASGGGAAPPAAVTASNTMPPPSPFSPKLMPPQQSSPDQGRNAKRRRQGSGGGGGSNSTAGGGEDQDPSPIIIGQGAGTAPGAPGAAAAAASSGGSDSRSKKKASGLPKIDVDGDGPSPMVVVGGGGAPFASSATPTPYLGATAASGGPPSGSGFDAGGGGGGGGGGVAETPSPPPSPFQPPANSSNMFPPASPSLSVDTQSNMFLGPSATGGAGPAVQQSGVTYSDYNCSADKMTPAVTVEKCLNPLAPCGACTEWLRKITEVNPDFKVVTFTDVSCEHIYVNPVN